MNSGRRKFLRFGGQLIGVTALSGAGWRLLANHPPSPDAKYTHHPKGPYVWRINPEKCTFCGLCETACVRTPSAVKAVNDPLKCSYCVACYGHLSDLTVASEQIDATGKRVCPHDAVLRKPLGGGHNGYHQYCIDPVNCTACGACAKRCNELGTKSMFLLIRPDLCLGCNRCSIAAVCPNGAIELEHCYAEDDYRGDYELDQELKSMEGDSNGYPNSDSNDSAPPPAADSPPAPSDSPQENSLPQPPAEPSGTLSDDPWAQ